MHTMIKSNDDHIVLLLRPEPKCKFSIPPHLMSVGSSMPSQHLEHILHAPRTCCA